MKAEFSICTRCKIAKTCHPDLFPVAIGMTGKVHVSKDRYELFLSSSCGNYTCDGDGRTAALEAMMNIDLYEAVMATELTGEIHAILAVPFGSEHKPTAESKHRVVTISGRVYVKQGDMYYATQKIEAELTGHDGCSMPNLVE